MDIWGNRQSVLGYQPNGNGIDSYGVDHSGFNTQDELQYQYARQNREKHLIDDYNKQGLTGNYPQYGTDFWGSSPDNNYGFGTTDIRGNIENMEKLALSNDINQNVGLSDDISSYELGTLSREAESNNGKNIFNNCKADKTGGCSYGNYQIETRQGTMNDYLNFLNRNPSYQEFYKTLQQAGGYEAALSGTDEFRNNWRTLSDNPEFLQSQHDFIVASKLKPALRFVKDIKGLDFDKRSPVVKDVLFSTAVQHGQGGASKVFHNALGYDASNLSDEDIINKIYDERGGNVGYFKSSSGDIRQNLNSNRFSKERARALQLYHHYSK